VSNAAAPREAGEEASGSMQQAGLTKEAYVRHAVQVSVARLVSTVLHTAYWI